MAIRLARRWSGMTLREIGERLNGSDYAAVSAMEHRFNKKLGASKMLQRYETQLQRMLNIET